MPDVFITLEEAAAFEGITYEAMKKRVQRSPKQHTSISIWMCITPLISLQVT